MKRAFPQKMKPVPSCAADNQAIAGEIRQAISGPRRVRTSAAMIGLAISMGASSLLLPQQGDGAVAAEPVAADTSAKLGSASSAEAAEASQTAEVASVQAADLREPSVKEAQMDRESTDWAAIEESESAAIAQRSSYANAFDSGWESDVRSQPQDEIAYEELRGADRSGSLESYEALSESYSVDPSEVTQVQQITYGLQPLELSDRAEYDEVDRRLEAEPEAAIKGINSNRNRFRTSLAELGDEESVISSEQPEQLSGWQSSTLEVEEATIQPRSISPREQSTPSALFERQEDLARPGFEPENSARTEESALEGVREAAEQPGEATRLWEAEAVRKSPKWNNRVNSEEKLEQELLPENARPIGSQQAGTVDSPRWMSPIDPDQKLDLSEAQEAATPAAKSGETLEFGVEPPAAQEEVFESSLEAEEVNLDLDKAIAEPDLSEAIVIEPEETTLAPAARLYQVNPGDTLDSIARKNRISPLELVQANQITDPDFIKVNQKLKIPLLENSSVVNGIVSFNPNEQPKASDTSLIGYTGLKPSESSGEIGLPSILLKQTTPSSTPTFPLVSPLKPSEAIGSVSDTLVAQGDRSTETASDSEASTDAVASETGAQTVSPEGASSQTNYIEGLRSDIIKLREKYREENAQSEYNAGTSVEQITPLTSSESEPAVSQSESTVEQASEIAEPATPQTLAEGQTKQRSSSEETEQTTSVGINATQAQTSENRYVDSLRAEIEKLREKYRSERATPVEGNTENRPTGTAEEETVPVSSKQPDVPSRHIDPQYSPDRHTDVLQAEINQLRQKYRTQQAQPADNASEPAPEPQNAQQEVIAVAPLGSESYAPLVQPSIGQMVSPDLPPLKTPDTYLPESTPRFNGFMWPAHGVLTSGYGWRWGRMHKGIDIAGPVGTPIYAAASGTVTFAGWNSGGYGNLVEIEHPDGSLTLYAHNHRIMVREGQFVDQGEQVAEMGSTGFSTGPHLHFELHTSGQGAVNPMAYLTEE